MLFKPVAGRFFVRQCSSSAFHLKTGQSWKSFTSSARCAQSSTARPASKNPSKPTSESLKFAGRPPEGLRLLERKVVKHKRIPLYEAPSHRTYLFSAYSLATVAFACSVYNSYTTFHDPILPLQTWHKVAFGAAAVMMSVLGTAAVGRTFRFVKSITAVESNGGMRIRFVIRSPLPFMDPYKFEVLPRQVVFSRRLVAGADHPGRPDIEVKKEPLTVKTVLTMPLKKVNSFMHGLFRAMRQIFTGEDQLKVEVEGQGNPFKIDMKGYLSSDLFRIGQS